MNTTESSTIQLSLRPAIAENNGAQTLAEQIWRINAERGHFRNVTEEGLRREIEAQEAGLVETTEENDKEEEDKVHTREGLAAARLELIRYVGYAASAAASVRTRAALTQAQPGLPGSRHGPRYDFASALQRCARAGHPVHVASPQKPRSAWHHTLREVATHAAYECRAAERRRRDEGLEDAESQRGG